MKNGRSSPRESNGPTSRHAPREGVTAASSAVNEAARPVPAPAGSPLVSGRLQRARKDAAEAFMAAVAWSNEAVTLCPPDRRFSEEDVCVIVDRAASGLAAQLELIYVVNRVRGSPPAICKEYRSRALREAREILNHHEAFADVVERGLHILTFEIAT